MKNDPLLITEAAAAIGRDIYTRHVERLLKDGIIQLCGLTPTDIMHIKGDFNGYTIYGNNGTRIFDELEDAIDFATSDASETAKTVTVHASGSIGF